MGFKTGYQIIESLGIIIIHRKKCTLSEIKFLIKEIVQNPFYKPSYNILIDLTETDIRLSLNEIKQCSDNFFNIYPSSEKIKLALITNSTEQTKKAVDFLMFKRMSSECQIFPTLNNAMNWLEIKSGSDLIKSRLHYLKQRERYF